eukprot:Skav210906  [mRNA]  locus=scaffold2900:307797:309425:+ [translate_table: standard]
MISNSNGFCQPKVSHGGPGTFEGPRRYLEWQRPMDLFLQYQSYCESTGMESAAFSTFRRVMLAIFKTHLRFRDRGDFGQCDVCHRLRKRIRNSQNKHLKAANVKLYSQHLLKQWADRAFYWNLRTISRNYFGQSLHFNKRFAGSDIASSVLTIIQDGMDQAKLRLPKWGYGKLSKSATKLYRPATHLMACWLHGFRLYLYLSDEDVKKNSETSMETLALSLQHLFEQSSSMALSIHLQQDNCYREGKNRFVMCFLLLLQVLGVFRFASMGFLRTCHSHEDVDQIFGQVARLLMGKRCDSASDMINLLEQCIEQGQPSEQSGRIRGSVASVSKLDQISCWKQFAGQLGVSFKGLRHVHYMRFCARKDLGADVLDHVSQLEELGQRWIPHGEDVFLVTKRWLSDTEIQRAIAVVPAAIVQQIRRGHEVPAGVAARRSIGEQVVKNLVKRVPICQKTGEITPEGARYLLGWCQRTLPQKPKPQRYTFLNHRWCDSLKAEVCQPGSWQRPRRVRHFDLTLQGDNQADSDSTDSDGPVHLPIGFDAG